MGRGVRVLLSGADREFQVSGGALKKIAPSGGRRENFGGISCEKSRFYAKNLYFSNFRGRRAKFLGYFMCKITVLRQKNHIFSNFRGARAGCAPSPWIRPWLCPGAYIMLLRRPCESIQNDEVPYSKC